MLAEISRGSAGAMLFYLAYFFGSCLAFTGAAQQGVEHAAVVQIVVVFAFTSSCSLTPFLQLRAIYRTVCIWAVTIILFGIQI